MNLCLQAARAALATALCSASTLALAQTYTLMSPPMPSGEYFACTLTNVSNQQVGVTKHQIVEGASVLWDGASSCFGYLQPGKTCITAARLANHARPYCRAQYIGLEGAVVGSFYGNFDAAGRQSDNGAAVALPLRAVPTIPLATAN